MVSYTAFSAFPELVLQRQKILSIGAVGFWRLRLVYVIDLSPVSGASASIFGTPYPRQFTICSSVASNAQTEFSKIVEGERGTGAIRVLRRLLDARGVSSSRRSTQCLSEAVAKFTKLCAASRPIQTAAFCVVRHEVVSCVTAAGSCEVKSRLLTPSPAHRLNATRNATG